MDNPQTGEHKKFYLKKNIGRRFQKSKTPNKNNIYSGDNIRRQRRYLSTIVEDEMRIGLCGPTSVCAMIVVAV